MPRIFGRTVPSVQFAYKTLRIKSHKPTVEDQNAPVYHTKPRPSDLTEHQWVRAMPLFPEKIIYSKNRKTPIRVLLNATMYRLINDKTLRQTVVEAPDFPPWGSIHFFEETMRRQGLWPEFLKRIGRLDLMEVLKKRMRLTPEQMRLSLEDDVEDSEERARMSLNQEPSVNARRVFGRTVRMSCQEHEYGCLLVRLPPFLSAQVLAFGSAIPDDLLAGDGRETAPHITIKYGFEDEDKDAALAKVIEFESPSITLGKLRCFKNDDADVLYVEVDSHDLERLHTALNPLAKKKDDYPYYTPHVTIAYLKPGAADPYLGDTSFEGLAFNPPKAFFSCKGGDETHAHFAECCQTEDEVVEAVTQRIFGRTVRFSAPPEVTDPLVYMEHPGYVHLPEHLEERRGDIATSDRDRRKEALQVLRQALQRPGKMGFHFVPMWTSRPDEDINRRRHDVILVADKDGNVSAHHSGVFADSEDSDVRRLYFDTPKALYDADVAVNEPDYEWPGTGDPRWGRLGPSLKQSAEAVADILRQHHDAAVSTGKLFAKTKFGRAEGVPVDRLLGETKEHGREGFDAAPELIMADALDTEGHSRAAQGIRKRHADVLPQVDYTKWDQPGGYHKIHRANVYPDALQMLTRHERTPEQDETKERLEDRLDWIGPNERGEHIVEPSRRPNKIGWQLSHAKVFGRTVRLAFDRPLKQLEFDFDALERANRESGQEHKQLRDDMTDEEKQERIKDITQSDYFVKLRKKAAERGIKPKTKREGLIGAFLDWLDEMKESASRSYPPGKPLPEERVPMPDTRSPEELARVRANLKAEIERARKERQVSDISGTDYFQNLRRKAQELKDKKEGKK